MRVNETSAARRLPAAAEAGRFAETLRRARAAQTASATAQESAAGPGARARSLELRKGARDGPAPLARREAARDEERASAGAVSEGTHEVRSDPSPVPELAAVVRALPAAIDAARLRDGAPLALSFGRSLDVELRAVPSGVEVVLRPEPRLLRAAEVELPRVVEALRLRGIEVAHAGVMSRGRGGRAR